MFWVREDLMERFLCDEVGTVRDVLELDLWFSGTSALCDRQKSNAILWYLRFLVAFFKATSTWVHPGQGRCR